VIELKQSTNRSPSLSVNQHKITSSKLLWICIIKQN